MHVYDMCDLCGRVGEFHTSTSASNADYMVKSLELDIVCITELRRARARLVVGNYASRTVPLKPRLIPRRWI